LSELQVKGGEFRQAIESLRQGLAALPTDREIKRRLAEQLMDSGSASEALPLLNDLAEDDQNALIGVLQLDALKILGMPEYDAMVVSLYSKFPENEEIAQAFAAQLIKNGKHTEAKTVLQAKLSQVQSNTPTALTYAEAVVGMDVHYSGEPKSISAQEMEKVESIVDRYLEQDSDHTHAQLVKAELLVGKAKYAEAFKLYSRLLEKQTSVDKSLWERIQAGFAQSAAFMGKFEVALAAIKQAVDSQPEWVGLRKIMANIYGLAGEVSDALVQAERVLDVAPQIVESALWFADFASGLGKSNTAEDKLAAIIELKSDDLLLRLKLAEMKIKNDKSVEALELLEAIKTNLSVESSETELLSAAKLYDSIHDIEAARNCLEYRAQSYASLSAGLDLAGYEYMQGQFAKAGQQLDKLSEPSDLVQCFKADVLIKTGELDKAISLVQNTIHTTQDDELELVFIPDGWKKLMASNYGNHSLEAKILLMQGKAATCLEVTALWLDGEPENADARILAIESTLALGEIPGEDLYLPIMSNETDDETIDHLTALKINSLLENNQAIEAQQIFEKVGKVDSLSLKLADVQLTLMTGHLADAEAILDEVVSAKDEIKAKELHIQLGLVRLFVKAAASLKRWNEALTYSSEAVAHDSWHLDCVMQALSTLTRAKEFAKTANSLSVEAHNPAAFLSKVNFEEELDGLAGLTGGKKEKEVERWLLRGKMAASPDSENIRAFALVTPTPEDAAAMVAALHANGQETTALQVAKKFPTDSQVLFELACVQADGDEAAALETLNTLIANDPLIPAAVALRGLIYENLGKLDVAINDLEQAISDWPNETLWRMKAASLWQNYGNNKNAIIQLQAAFDRSPENAEAALELGKAYEAEGDSQKAVEILVPLSNQNPNFYEAWEALAESQSNCDQLEHALESAKKASQVNPFSIKPYLMSGKIHMLNGNLDKALDMARTAVTQNKKDANAILFLAKVLHERGEKQQALAALEMTNQCDNVTVQTMVEHVNLVKEINGGAYAKELISSFSEKYPENVDLMKMLASAQEENGDTADAEMTVKRALQVEPDEPDLHLFLGKISVETGQLDQAIHHLSQGIAQKAASTDGYLMLSKVYEQQREFTKALDALKQAMDAAPNDTRSYLAAANLYRNSKNYNAAEKVLQKAVEIDPQDVTIRRQLGALLALKLVHHSQEASSQS
ncbi:MAG: tetratricopeptide repeat protein, partial [Anaerolineaceae bacterium]